MTSGLSHLFLCSYHGTPQDEQSLQWDGVIHTKGGSFLFSSEIPSQACSEVAF